MSGFFEQEQLRMVEMCLTDVDAMSRAALRAPNLVSGFEVARERFSLLVL